MTSPRQLTRRWIVVGAGGLLGGAVSSLVDGDPAAELVRVTVPWSDHEQSVQALSAQIGAVVSSGAPWTLLWCAGAAVVASSPEALADERSVIERSLAAVAGALASTGDAGPGCVVLASSAGGVYAGSSEAPFTELTPTAPLAPYGWSKLAVEGLFRDFAERTGVPLVVARYSNLYGPGQDTTKAQGLVSQLCLSHLRGRTSSIYVPGDTIRDYLFIDDAAALTVDVARRAADAPSGTVVTKILASQQGVTIGSLIGELQRIVKRRPSIVWGSHFTAAVQAPDLRFRSVVWTDLDERTLTPLPAGIHRTLLALGAGR